MSLGVKSINVFTELDRLKIKWVAAGEDEIRVCCPVHEDSTPSASLNVKEHVWKCYVPNCNASGDFISFLAYALKQERKLVLVDLQSRYPDIGGVSEIPSNTVEKFHKALHEAGPLLEELKKRGVTEEMMREARLGFHDGRITIPVYDSTGRCVNVRRYLPGAPGPQKMRNTTGHAGPHLYRIETLRKDTAVIVCGGEMKALVAGVLLRDKGIDAVCSTGGEGHWKPEWTQVLSGRDVYVCMDIDDPGVSAARRMASQLYGHAKSVRILRLPLDINVYKKGDINDWVGKEGAKAEDIERLCRGTMEWAPPSQKPIQRTAPQPLELAEAITDGNVGKMIEVKAVIAAADQTPFLVPKDVDIECTRDQPGCISCPVPHLTQGEEGWTRMVLDPYSPAILGMVGTSEKIQIAKLMEALGIPLCKAVKFRTRTHHIVHDVRLAAPMDITGNRVGDSWYPAMMVQRELTELNIACKMIGSVHPHPNTAQAVALISESQELEDTLTSYHPSDADIRDLAATFKLHTTNEETLNRKVHSIYEDLEANVTWIYDRRDMHLAYDLAWHSPLLFNFAGRQTNGWVNLLVIGDSSQGKSECGLRLMKHYGCGDRIDCKNATVAGLLGGLEQLGNRWFVRWGAIPAHDRALCIMEELKGASVEVLSKLTDMRSSGIAELPKIERRRTLARTRLIMISNPRTPRPMASFHFGVEAIHELIGSLEDVRRFDLAIAVGRGEVDDAVINMAPSERTKVPHRITAELSKKLVLWAWTRTPEQIIINDTTTDKIVKCAIELCKKFHEALPLVDQGTIRLKLARLSTAFAARLFSTRDGHTLDVLPQHVEFVTQYITRVYSTKVMGYDDFSIAQKLISQIQHPDQIERAVRNTRHPVDLASVLLRRDTISLDDIVSAAACDQDTGRAILSLFVRKGALLRTSRSEYAKNPQFILILKKIASEIDNTVNQHNTNGDEF